ncbi:hypothetical protein b3_0256 [Synechococcus phage B3]|nr:hypothetical protein b3_0256 [Synechococcus phage B3]QGT54863.1 hypothetical protein b23_0249 [Synechococcus phage B23]
MAKGFSVKANNPTPQDEPWDYGKIKEKMRGKKIVFCLPGRNCSYTFLKSFVQLCFDLVQNQMSIQISQDYSSMVNFARCKVLGANVTKGPWQDPWQGQLEYDYQLWIDNDIVFNSEKFWQLCDLMVKDSPVEKEFDVKEYPLWDISDEELYNMNKSDFTVRRERIRRLNKLANPIVSGWYSTEDGRTTSCAHWLEADDFIKNGGVMNHETIESISKRNKPFTVDYVGGGWMMVAKGVFECMEYPWWGPKLQTFENGIQDFCGEDVSFCLDAKDLGIDIIVDPRVRVGHEKTRIL